MMQQQKVAKLARPKSGENWIRQVEHWIVRGGSLALSIVSGHTVYWFFSAMDGVDKVEPYMTFLTALAIGLLGYVILRGLTHRLMQGEKIRVYIPLCFILIGVETVSNFMKAIVGVHDDRWLSFCPPLLVQPMTYVTYVVLSIIPAFTVFLAYVDMDLERAVHVVGSAVSTLVGNKAATPTPFAPVQPPVSPVQRYIPQQPVQPVQKYVPQQPAVSANTMPNNGSLPFGSIPPYPSNAPTQAFPVSQVPQQPLAAGFQGLMNNVSRWAGGVNGQPVQPPQSSQPSQFLQQP